MLHSEPCVLNCFIFDRCSVLASFLERIKMKWFFNLNENTDSTFFTAWVVPAGNLADCVQPQQLGQHLCSLGGITQGKNGPASTRCNTACCLLDHCSDRTLISEGDSDKCIHICINSNHSYLTAVALHSVDNIQRELSKKIKPQKTEWKPSTLRVT